MPAAAETQAVTRALPRWAACKRVTETHGPYEVGEFRVLRVGGIVALHFGTPVGRIVVHVREHSFVRHARGECDDHGKPFRTLAEIERARLEAEGELPAPTAPEPPRLPRGRARPDCEAAWEFLTTHPHMRVADVAARFGLEHGDLKNWIGTHHNKELPLLRQAAGLTRRGTPAARAA